MHPIYNHEYIDLFKSKSLSQLIYVSEKVPVNIFSFFSRFCKFAIYTCETDLTTVIAKKKYYAPGL